MNLSLKWYTGIDTYTYSVQYINIRKLWCLLKGEYKNLNLKSGSGTSGGPSLEGQSQFKKMLVLLSIVNWIKKREPS